MSDNNLEAIGREQIAIMRAVEQERSLGAHRLAELERAAETTRAAVADALREDRERSVAWVKQNADGLLSYGDLVRRIRRGTPVSGTGGAR